MLSKKEERGNWANWLEFLFSCVGCMVGIGNIWRFPFVCYRSGGAAFLVPYFIAMFVCGLPLIFLEMSYCQYSNLGPGRVWIICPLFKGIGAGMIILTSVISCYYNVVLSWTLYYLGMSFTSVLPWSSCDNSWNTQHCVDVFGFSYGNSSMNQTSKVLHNSSDLNYTISSTEEYWLNHVLEDTGTFDTLGSVRWQLIVCLFVAWFCVFLCLIKGIKSSGKVVYVAATVPYLILLALLVRGCLLPGALKGVQYYVIPRWEKLLDPKVWQDAAVQVFYSAGIGWGGISTLASYNKFHNNCYRDAMILPVLDCLTSWFAGFVIFVFLGYMAHIEGKDVDAVVASGPGLSFVTYPHAVATMPVSQLWAFFFFAMLFLVGMDSQFVHIQTITTGITDAVPYIGETSRRKTILTACICIIGFILGIPFATQGGSHLLNHIDGYIATISVMLLACLETLILSWMYGVNRLYDDITSMIGYTPNSIWKPLWLVISPAFILVLWCFGIYDIHLKSIINNKDIASIVIGVIIGILPLIPLPICFIKQLTQHKGNLYQKFRSSVKPTKEWKSVIERDYFETSANQIPLL